MAGWGVPPPGVAAKGVGNIYTPGGVFPPGVAAGGSPKTVSPSSVPPQGWRRVQRWGTKTLPHPVFPPRVAAGTRQGSCCRVVDVKAIRGCLGNGLVYDGCHCGRYMFVLKSLCHAFGSR